VNLFILEPARNPTMMRWISAGAASLALLAAGLVHGFWTDRWATSTALNGPVARLADVPMQIGDWEGSEIEVKAGSAGPGVPGCIQRTYVNRKGGGSVVLALVNGRPGPVSIHTPDACYGASGYKVGTKSQVRLDTNGSPAQFWKADAVKTNTTSEQRLRIYWGWNGGDGWQAPADARQAFPRHRVSVLHKLYVLRDLNASAGVAASSSGSLQGRDPNGREPCEAFLEELLPVLQRTLLEGRS
jgi:hypothetical protein